MNKKILISRKIFIVCGLLLLAFGIFNFIPNNLQRDLNNTISADTHFLNNDVEFTSPDLINNSPSKKVLYDSSEIEASIKTTDKRIYVLDQFFLMHNSPLYGTGKLFVDACKKYGAPADCILVAAIAKHETNLCKYSTSAQMHNCWGFGGPAQYRVKFSSWKEGIDRVTDVLVNQYGIRYMNDPSLMERTFCGTEDPLCPGWGNRVKNIMNEINDYSISLGMGSLYELRN